MPASSETVATVTLPDHVDLHARPAAEFVKAALAFEAAIAVEAGDRTADAKSLLSVLGLGARRGTELRLRADGDDAGTAVTTLSDVVAGLVE
jgi:phosphotransferase system HPr (HPr) family protein